MPNFKLTLTAILILAACSGAQSIAELLSGTPELRNFTSVVSMYPDFVSILTGSSNIILLAPNNKAVFDTMKMMLTPTGNDAQHIKSLLAYHVLNGTYRPAGFGNKPEFLPTLLTTKRCANITAGEPRVVKAILMDDHPSLYSSLNKVSILSRAVSPPTHLQFFWSSSYPVSTSFLNTIVLLCPLQLLHSFAEKYQEFMSSSTPVEQ